MTELPESLPDDPQKLKELLQIICSERQDLFERLRLLEHRYKLEMRKGYGRKAEPFNPDQLALFAESEVEESVSEAQEEAATAGSKPATEEVRKKGHGRRKPSPLLPRKPIIHDVSDDEKVCPHCSWKRELCGRIVSLQLDYTPGMAFYWENIRLKYACRTCEGHLIAAPAPEQPIARGMQQGCCLTLPQASLQTICHCIVFKTF
jgi:transposase